MATSTIQCVSPAIETGTVTIGVGVSSGHIRIYKVGRIVVAKIYINYSANIAANETMATLPWKPNDIMFATVNDTSAGTFFEVQVNNDGTLQNRLAITKAHWILGEIVYFTND